MMFFAVRRHGLKIYSLWVMLSLMGVGLGMLAYAQDATPTPTPPHWEYEGEAGPEVWGNLSSEYALCNTGHAQSPIDVTEIQSVDLADIAFNYVPSKLTISHNGHTIQVDYDTGSSIIYNEIPYNLAQFHFHTPSEHTADGESFPMEVHFVHKSASGALAVVGVIFIESEVDNPAYAPIFENMPTVQTTPQVIDQMIDANALLPTGRAFITYTGSLTTPPCSEGVRWLLINEPVELSAAQIESFRAIFELNARPVQPLNTRDLLGDSTGS